MTTNLLDPVPTETEQHFLFADATLLTVVRTAPSDLTLQVRVPPRRACRVHRDGNAAWCVRCDGDAGPPSQHPSGAEALFAAACALHADAGETHPAFDDKDAQVADDDLFGQCRTLSFWMPAPPAPTLKEALKMVNGHQTGMQVHPVFMAEAATMCEHWFTGIVEADAPMPLPGRPLTLYGPWLIYPVASDPGWVEPFAEEEPARRRHRDLLDMGYRPRVRHKPPGTPQHDTGQDITAQWTNMDISA